MALLQLPKMCYRWRALRHLVEFSEVFSLGYLMVVPGKQSTEIIPMYCSLIADFLGVQLQVQVCL